MTDDWSAAADWIRDADALVITAGAGMGVDSGLPDFRGNEGFWNAYPPARRLGLSFVDLANPRWFDDDPTLAWGFYGHRLELYLATKPHAGFDVLREWAEDKPAFVFTSNVDGAFQRAGFDEAVVEECHGSLMHLQCSRPCSEDIWGAEGFDPDVDLDRLRATGDLPRCPHCGALARPNVLMFGDWRWVGRRSEQQGERLRAWLGTVSSPVVLEFGAGTAVPTVRMFGEQLVRAGARLIRVNPREDDVPPGQIALRSGARDALERLDALV